MTKAIRIAILILAVTCAGALLAQEHGTATQPATREAAPEQAPAAHQASTTQGEAPQHGIEQKLARESAEAAHEGEEDEHGNLKRSAVVKWIGHKLGIGDNAAYWIFVILNFTVLIGGIGWAMRSSVPAMFRSRSENIQKGLEEARKASAEASARLAEIEARLAKLDDEVAEIRTAAAADFSAEEQRIKAAAEQDARNVVESAQQEIETASKMAQRELRTYAAELAVSIAQKKISVDATTDKELVNGFVAQLGKEGK